MIQRPIFSNSELYCIEEAVKEELQTFNNTTQESLRKEDVKLIRDEMNNILEKIMEWKKQECILTKALKQLKPRR